jgi:hypothetical protein
MGVFKSLMKLVERQAEVTTLIMKKKAYLKQRVRARLNLLSVLGLSLTKQASFPSAAPSNSPIMPVRTLRKHTEDSEIDETQIYCFQDYRVSPENSFVL